jgi:hypothetical protein
MIAAVRSLVVASLVAGPFVALPAVVTPLAAQSTAAAQPAPMVPKWMRSLQLSADQEKKIASLHHDAHAQMDAAKKSWKAAGKSPDTDPALKAELQRMMDAEHAAFRAALNPSQQVAYDAALKAHLAGEHAMEHGKAAAPKTKP